MSQLELFAAPPARANAAVTAQPPKVCPLHGADYVCESCPEGYATDSTGFANPSLLRGRLALRFCEGCGLEKTPGEWNHADWRHCTTCQPLGTISEAQRPSWEAINREKWSDMIARRQRAAHP